MNCVIRNTGKRNIFAFSTAIIFTVMRGGTEHLNAEPLHSPKGAEVFGPPQQVILVPPPRKTVTIGWSFPVNFETSDLVFKVYSTTNLTFRLNEWSLMTNVPGTLRETVLPADQPRAFFVVTASNYLGESEFARND
ncbi:MAG: hypothetical protein H7Y43_16040 [Akkermansiaceae bacterium]|nr:hypothetical protein [Verrucomicrobiales bacterium]